MVKIKKKKLIIGEVEKKIDYSKNKPYLVLAGLVQIEKIVRIIAEKHDGCYTTEQEKKFDRLHKSLGGFSKVLNKHFVFSPMDLILNTGLYTKAMTKYQNGENIGLSLGDYEGTKEIKDLYINMVFYIGVLEGINDLQKDDLSKYAVNLKIQLLSVKNLIEKEYNNFGIGKEKFETQRKKHLEG